jgi:molybdopterin-guanine dinucleotide biosynthesis protein A
MEVIEPRIHKSALTTSWAIYGSSCEVIQKWAELFQTACPRISIYLDADHQEQTNPQGLTFGRGYALHSSHVVSPSPWKVHWINGNHFSGPRQIIIHDPNKLPSLERRRAQLTQVDLVISNVGMPAHLLEWGVVSENTQCIAPEELELIHQWVQTQVPQPPLAALILTGGKSERMGEDKAMLEYHGIPQWKFLKMECEKRGLPVFVSCQKEQQDFWLSNGMEVVVDAWSNMGPIAGILSAMQLQPSFSWMVMACDMPNWNAAAMQSLIEHRKLQKGVTAFYNQEKKWHEPLGAIWESDIEGALFQWTWVAKCPRKFLNHIPIQSIPLTDQDWLDNINDPISREHWLKRRGE